MQVGRDFPSRVARLVFAGLMGLAWCGFADYCAAQPSPDPATGPSTQPASGDRRSAADELNRLLNGLNTIDKEGPRDTFDVAAVVANVGRDPVKLFEWVRDQTFWVPYQGALRGPVGVLMDRVGSSLDRSLLLAELLRNAGHQVRLVHAALSPEQAMNLIGKVRPLPENWLANVDAAVDEQKFQDQLTDFSTRFGLDADRFKASSNRAAVQADRIAEDAVGRIAEQAPAVMDAINLPAPTEPPDKASAAPMQDAVAAAQDLWWVALEQNGSWTNLDPTFPTAVPGATSFDVAGQARDYDGKLPAEAELCHQVQIQVTIERWDAGKLHEEPVLKYTLRPADVLGKRVSLGHIPTDWPGNMNLLVEQDGAGKLSQAAAQQHEWAPLLAVGSENVIQGSFNAGGRINPHPNLDAMSKVGGSVKSGASGALDAFDTAPPKPVDQGQLTAEWIDYQIQTPGRASTTIRRELFDLLGPAARHAVGTPDQDVPKPQITDAQALQRSLSTLGETEILLQPCLLSRSFVGHVAVRGVLANAPILQAIAARPKPDRKFTGEQLDKITPQPGLVYGLGYARGQWSPVHGQVYLDRVNILSYHQLIRQDPVGKMYTWEGFDIVANDVAVRSGAVSGAPGGRTIRLTQGVADTVAEAALVRGGGSAVESTSELFSTASARGERWITLHKGDETGALGSIQLPKDVQARIAQELTEGYVVLVPKAPPPGDGHVRIAWWRVDPATGQTLGIGQQGWGETAAENAMMYVRIALKALLAFKCISSAMAGPGAGGGVALCIVIGILGGAGLAVGGLGGGALGYAADIFSAMK